MQFVTDGPDIPNTLLQAHEDGRVVFFCGAGISRPAGLPGFKGLVDSIYKDVNTVMENNERAAYVKGQFDATLNLLEHRLPGQRLKVRKALEKGLQPKWRRRDATKTHSALLQLARCKEGKLRLVTTNFDRIFERAAKRTKQSISTFTAPTLPIPKNSRWDGLVYLHGQLPNKDDPSALNRLVLTSGDFGLAYLIERWAARFVSELFRNYVVCFIGYSIDDPVMRYMVDAIAADRMLGEDAPQAFALGGFEAGKELKEKEEWESKNIIPILYESTNDSDGHFLLHKTIQAWAETYRDGILGKERIVVDYALARPSASTREDDFVGRMLWALSHESGKPAEHFANFNPVPPLEWLEAFSADCYRLDDLTHFGIRPSSDGGADLHYSLIHRPAPYEKAPWMGLVSSGKRETDWDKVMLQLSRWLVRHLNDPDLILWFSERGGYLHDQLARQIHIELERVLALIDEGKALELDEIKTHSPNAIPDPFMRTLWRLLLSGQVIKYSHDFGLYEWKRQIKREGLTTTLRLEFRKLLAPKVTLEKPMRWYAEDDQGQTRASIKQLVDYELKLTAGHVHSTLIDLDDEHWRAALPLLLDDIQQLLLDALGLLQELGSSNNQSDLSWLYLPSISQHSQNRNHYDWVTLIVLLRDAWLAINKDEPKRAHHIALGWFDIPYPTFKRLALFAAAQGTGVSPSQWVEWLLSGNSQWLWSTETRRETMRLLVQQGHNLIPASQMVLEAAIISGPPKDTYKGSTEPERSQEIMDKAVWLLLAKLHKGSGKLGTEAMAIFNSLSKSNTQWKLEDNDRDEFLYWMSGTGSPDFESTKEIEVVPRNRSDLVSWLQRPQSEPRLFHEDTWRDTCKNRFYLTFLALRDLAMDGHWPQEHWNKAIQVWSDDKQILRSWRWAAPLVQTMPDAVLQKNRHSVTWWMEAASKSINCHEEILLALCNRMLSFEMDTSTGIIMNGEAVERTVTDAINHPIGHVTSSLLNLWFKGKPADNELLPNDIKPLFTLICNTETSQYCHGRVLLASRVISFYRVDQSWTESNLIPLFDWGRSLAEAKAAWEGFLWSPRLYHPLLIALKPYFLETASHYQTLGNHHQFAAFLTYAALSPIEGYTTGDFQTAFSNIPVEALNKSAQALTQVLEGASGNQEEYWINRILPFWQNVWPKSLNLVTQNVATPLARLSIAAGLEFPNALAEVYDWLQPLKNPNYTITKLHKSGLCARFPESAQLLLNIIIDDQSSDAINLQKCRQEIANNLP